MFSCDFSPTDAKASSSFDHLTPPCGQLFRELEDELSLRANAPLPEDLNLLEDTAARLLDILSACHFCGHLSDALLLSGRSYLRRIALAMAGAPQLPALRQGEAAQEADGHPALALVSGPARQKTQGDKMIH